MTTFTCLPITRASLSAARLHTHHQRDVSAQHRVSVTYSESVVAITQLVRVNKYNVLSIP
jgi:hypothetical protein